MMSVGVLLALGLLIEVALAVYVLVLTQQEQSVFRELVRRAGDDFVSAVDDLPLPYRTLARPLADQLAMDQELDGALLDAIVETTRQPFKKPLWMRLSVGAVCAIAFLAPASYGLLSAATQVVSAWNEAQSLDHSLVLLRGQTELEGPFMVLRQAFQGSALLFFGVAFLWALAWYLRRPEVREARFIRALLEAAARASPQSAAPASGRLSELIAPRRGLERPIAAMLICLGGITAGWLVLYETADVRAANDREPRYEVWPRTISPPIATTSEVRLPTARAGAPLEVTPPPSLVIGPDKASFGGPLLVTLIDGELPADWMSDVPDELSKMLAQAAGRVALLAHRDLALDVVVELLQFLQAKHDIDRFELIVERQLERGGRPLQSAIPLAIEESPERPRAITVSVSDRGIRILPEDEVRTFESEDWVAALQRAVRARPELLRTKDRSVVELQIEDSELTYGRFVDVLAAADTACMGKSDCGLPGLRLEFSLPAAPSP